jgi:hypothetical protein
MTSGHLSRQPEDTRYDYSYHTLDVFGGRIGGLVRQSMIVFILNWISGGACRSERLRSVQPPPTQASSSYSGATNC